MNLTVGVRRAVLGLLQVLGVHGNHARVLLQRVHILDHALGDQLLPRVRLGVALALLELIDVATLEQQLLILDNEERSANAARVRVDANLSLLDLANDGHLGHDDVHVTTQLLERVDELIGVAVHTDPAAVDKHLGGLLDGGRRDLVQILHAPLLEELENRVDLRADGHVGHQSEVLDEADGVALGRLRRTDDAPLRVVELTGLGELAIATDRRVHATQMRQGRGECEAIQHL